MTKLSLFASVLFLSGLCCLGAVAVEDYKPAAYDLGWRISSSNHFTKLTQRKGTVGTIFLGDSITWLWGVKATNPNKGGAEVFKKYFKGPWIFGISGAYIENILWQLTEGKQLDGIRIKNIVLMIGTNNFIRKDSPERVARGYQQIVETIKAKQPQTKILLLTQPPLSFYGKPEFDRAPQRAAALIEKLADGKQVFFLNLDSCFLDENNKHKNLRDGVHPTPQGYEEMAKLIAPMLEKMQAPPPAPVATEPAATPAK